MAVTYLLLSLFVILPFSCCQRWSYLNNKIMTLKFKLEDEFEGLLNETLDMRAELELYKRTLDEHLTETSLEFPGVSADDNDGQSDNLAIRSLLRTIQTQNSEISQLKENMENEKEEKEALRGQINTLMEQYRSLQSKMDDLTSGNGIRADATEMQRFSNNKEAIMAVRRAVKAEKYAIRRLQVEFEELKSQIAEGNAGNNAELESRMDQLNITSEGLAAELQQLSATVAGQTRQLHHLGNVTADLGRGSNSTSQFKAKVASTIRQMAAAILKNEKCCRAGSNASATVPSTGTGQLYTYSYVVSPLRGATLAGVIKIGSRVIRGQDWAWGTQDGVPPGPGTVTAWYRGDKSTQQVMVKWDKGGSANYRIGAFGKYDLYLIHDLSTETADDAMTTSTPPEILPIYGEALYEAIKVGSRVVRGADWSWGIQDGVPPGPGTVTMWMNDDRSTKEVIVRWDAGRTANYRVGAHGKYDLYLTKDQPSK